MSNNQDDIKALEVLGHAVDSLVAAYVAVHETEAERSQLAESLLRESFKKCISCKAEGKVINLAAIELCQDTDCPLQKTNSMMAAAVAVLLGAKTSLWGQH